MTISAPSSLPFHRENNRICILKQWKSLFLLNSLPTFPGDVIFERPPISRPGLALYTIVHKYWELRDS